MLALAALTWPAWGRGDEGSRMPFELVRSLRAIQDRIAHGDAAAQAGQSKLLAEIGLQLQRVDAAAWKEPRNARAAVIYVLSGGDPAVLKRLRDVGPLVGIEEILIDGTLAYSEGRSTEAEPLLDIDTRPLDSNIAGHIALVQSVLALKKDVNKALAFLDEARLRSPGTLVEEAALRRQAFLVLAAGNRDRFEMLSSNYLRRFGDSIYAGSFRRQFAAEVVGEKYAIDSSRLKKLEAMLDDLDPAQRLELHLAIAEDGTVRGKVEAAKMAAEHAFRLAKDSNATKARAELYRGAALIATDEFERGVADLKSVDRSLLGPPDAELLDAAFSLAGQMRVWPETRDMIGGLQDLEAKAAQAEQPIVLATSKSLAVAQRAISQVDQMLNGAAK
jgi:chemotaxis protein MotC